MWLLVERGMSVHSVHRWIAMQSSRDCLVRPYPAFIRRVQHHLANSPIWLLRTTMGFGYSPLHRRQLQ